MAAEMFAADTNSCQFQVNTLLRDSTSLKPLSLHAKTDSGISFSGSLEEAKFMPLWRNHTKEPQGTKREKQLGEQE